MPSMEIDLSRFNGQDDSLCKCCPYGCHIDIDFVSFTEKMLSTENAVERLKAFKQKVKSDMEKILALGTPITESMARLQVSTRDAGCTVKPTYKDVGVSTIAQFTDASTDYTAFEEPPFTPTSPSHSEIPNINDFFSKPLEGSEKVESSSISGSLMSLQEPREKITQTKNIQEALKTLNNALLRGRTTRQVSTAINNILRDWFKVAGANTANPLDVQDYLNCYEDHSPQLLRYIVNMPDGNGNTALHYAVSHENFDVVSILLNSNVCDPNKANKAGYTSVMLVALAKIVTEGHRQVVQRLLSMSDVNIKAAQHSQTALILGASHGRLDTVKLLIEAGADVNVQDEDGSTALMCAAEHGHMDIVKHLLAQKNCDSNIVDSDGYTALRVAMEAGNKDIGVMLYAHMHFYSRPSFRRTSKSTSLLLSKRSRSLAPTASTSPSPVVAEMLNSSSSINFMNVTTKMI